MVSYRDMTDQERAEFSKKQREEFEEKYKGRIDPKTLRWTNGNDANNAPFSNDMLASVSVSSEK